MTEQESKHLLNRVAVILASVDTEAQTEHVKQGGDCQGWDNQIRLAAGLPVTLKHDARAGATWAAPDWDEPSPRPADSEDLTYEDGSLWGEESEEYGIATSDEPVNGLVPEVFWIQSGTSELPFVCDVEGEDHYCVRGSVDGTVFEFTPDQSDDEIADSLRECYSVFDLEIDN